MKPLRAAIFGTGFMGRVHTEATRRLGYVEIAAVAASSEDKARAFAEQHNIPRATADWQSLCADPSFDAIHICTPNLLHYPMAKLALEHGRNVLLEKPLTMTIPEARELLALAEAKGVVHGINHNLRAYPCVQQARAMVAAGELGEVLMSQGTYYQDWLLYDTDWNWRLDKVLNGPLRTIADIGSHWMDMVQHVTGLPITAVCADMATFHATRKRPHGSIETFAGKKHVPAEYEVIPIDTDDYASVLFRLGDRARGMYSVTQMAVGRKNRFALEVYGTKSSIAWDQERPDELWIGQRNEPNRIMLKDASLFHSKAGTYVDQPGGHAEGYDDTHKQTIRRFYDRVANPSTSIEYPTFADGVRGMELLEKVAESARTQSWVKT